MLQAAATPPATSPKPAPPPERFSILLQDCPRETNAKGDVVVCADSPNAQRIPLPDERVPSGPVPSNPNLTGIGALGADGTPCAARQGGCLVGFGPPIVPMVKGLVNAAKSAFARKPDKSNRIPIPLD
nr:hypothetical protein [Sphingomonas jinjuensis]